MSWCRFGSHCASTTPAFEDNLNCTPGEVCPGSDVYIFEHIDGFIQCCGCSLQKTDLVSFNAKNTEEMQDHIEEHIVAGDHVRPSLRKVASRKLTKFWEEFYNE